MSSRQIPQLAAVAAIFALEFYCAFYVSAEWGWLFGLGLLLLFCLLLGKWLTGRMLGIFIGQRNLMSLSRLQVVAWSVVIFSGYLVAVIQRLKSGVASPFDLQIDPYLWATLGISTASFVVTPMILESKANATPSDAAVQSAGKALQENPADVGNNAVGKLYSNKTMADASFSDIFQGDEIGNTAYIDVSKVQMVMISVVLIGSYAMALWAKFGGGDFTLPAFTAGQVQLLGVSHAGYLVFKAANHTT